MNVAHVITGLDTGGAETVLSRLVGARKKARRDVVVISLTSHGEIGKRIEAAGVPVRPLGLRPGLPPMAAVGRLARLLREVRPDVVQTWMYHADLVGGLAARLAGIRSLVWGVRHSVHTASTTKRSTRMVIRACALMSRWMPASIICCADAAAEAHRSMGYAPAKLRVIGNGLDLETFRPSATDRAAVRSELGISEAEKVVALVARYDPNKDHRTFFEAARSVAKSDPGARFVLCGKGIDASNAELMRLISPEIGQRLSLLGLRRDVQRILNGADVVVSSSSSEGFPNTIAEALACGVPCVATDVGHSKVILGDAGVIVPPGDAEALGRAVLRLLAAGEPERRRLGEIGRERIAARFSVDQMSAAYDAEYARVWGTLRT